jgi:transposase
VGKTRRGPATKLVAIADRSGLPISATIASGERNEVTLVDDAVKQRFTAQTPQRLIGDRAYDSAKLQAQLQDQGIELIAPKRTNHYTRKQDGRPLRRYKRRWKVERLFAWLLRSRRVSTRYERKAENYLGFVHIGCLVILLRHL